MSDSAEIRQIRQRVWIDDWDKRQPGKKRICTGGLFYIYPMSWPTFKKYIDEVIDENISHLKKVRKFPDKSQWWRIIVEEQGEYDPDWWYEFNFLVDEIEKKLNTIFTISKEKKTELQQLIESKIHLKNQKIKYGIFTCQDTILPLFFEPSYNRNLDVEFVKFKNWNEGLVAFQSNLNPINVALHNFPTTVAFNTIINSEQPLFFYPFFSFSGYGIFVKKNSIKKIAIKYNQKNISNFEQLKDEAKKELFETNNILVERYTDFEWAILSFCRALNCETNKVFANLKNCNTNEAKEKFLNDEIGEFNIYCTNPINIFDLLRNAPKDFLELISHNDGILDHHNFNGLICTIEYLNNNSEIIAELIATWFNDIVRLKRELKNARSASGLKHCKTLQNLMYFLKVHIPSNIIIDDLLNIYEGHNTFYDSPLEAFNKFYQEVLVKENNSFKNNQEISLVQLGKMEDTDNEVERMMILIKNYMKNL